MVAESEIFTFWSSEINFSYPLSDEPLFSFFTANETAIIAPSDSAAAKAESTITVVI